MSSLKQTAPAISIVLSRASERARTSIVLARFCAVAVLAAAALYPPLAANTADYRAPQASSSPQSAINRLPTAGKPRVSQEVQITGDQLWTDTGIALNPGEHLIVHASGKLRYADANADNDPGGLPRGYKDLLRILPFNGAGRGALLGRVGPADVGQPFLLGAERNLVVPVAGHLFLGINQASDDLGDGVYKVEIEVDAADNASKYQPAREVNAIPGIDAQLFAKIPRRVADRYGNPGDMVNFLVIGSEAVMQKIFTNAGWVKVDADVRDTVLHGLIVSLSKEAYLTMPMSQLFLFGRPQDYGWAHAEPIRVVASRNHLRLWKAPMKLNGQTLWIGAATHDIGFERDERNNKVTHKIDPDIDLERAYVEKTLTSTGLVSQITYFSPMDALKEAYTATGGSFHSDGRVLVLDLAQHGSDGASAIGVLKHNDFAPRSCCTARAVSPVASEHFACKFAHCWA